MTLVLVFGSNVDNCSANKLDERDVNGATRLIKSAFTWTLPMISDVLGRTSSPEPVEPSPFQAQPKPDPCKGFELGSGLA